MKTNTKRWMWAVGVLLTGLGVTGCFGEPDFSDTPTVSDPIITKETLPASADRRTPRRDSVVITIKFQDGDGDLGEDVQIDSTRIRRTVFASQSWGNYQIRTFRLVNNRFEEVVLSETGKVFFPRLFAPNQKGPLEGTLDFSQIFFYGNQFRIFPTKFRIKIRDRNLRESNEIETDTVNVPFPAQ